MNIIRNRSFDEERALYGSSGLMIRNCKFDGPADGESALKESHDISVDNCLMNLRYPFWHDHNLRISDSEMTELCRAALWYSDNIEIINTKMYGIKAMRECSDVHLDNCDIDSPEFGWSVRRITADHTKVRSEYFMMRSENLIFKDVELTGKYSFQYITDSIIDNCRFDTKDAFWHAKNTVIKNSIIKGEYLAWYCENVTFENCIITGTQPFCYCKNLTLINCEMHDADLCFERSEVEATVTTPVISIKNPRSGHIYVPYAEEIIHNDPDAMCEIVLKQK